MVVLTPRAFKALIRAIERDSPNACIDDQGVLYLTNMQLTPKQLQYLVMALQTNTTVTTLHLCGTPIGHTEIANLIRALDQNTTLTSLNLSNTGITDAGANVLSQFLIRNTSLKHIDLSQNTLSRETQRYLGANVRRNRTLTQLNFTFTDDTIQQRVTAHLAQNLNNTDTRRRRSRRV